MEILSSKISLEWKYCKFYSQQIEISEELIQDKCTIFLQENLGVLCCFSCFPAPADCQVLWISEQSQATWHTAEPCLSQYKICC